MARVIRGYPHIKFRYLITPSETLPAQYIPIFATPEEIAFQLEIGERDTIEVIKRGQGAHFHKVAERFGIKKPN